MVGSTLIMRKLFLITYSIIILLSNAGAQSEPAFDIDKMRGSTLTLFVFLSPECPLCKNYTKDLNELAKQFPRDVKIIGIISGDAYSAKEVKSFQRKFDVSYPLYIDNHLQLTRRLNARVTPEVVLLDSIGGLIYRGAIDDWVVKLGQTRIKRSRYYLKDAIESYLKGQAVAVSETEPKGCYINEF